MTFFILSSNSPRYFAPESISGRSSAAILFERNPSGTVPSAIFIASPSAIAVFPTPGSPIRHGLFFVRRDRMRITASVSPPRPKTGSSSPLSAAAERSVPYFRMTDGSFFAVFGAPSFSDTVFEAQIMSAYMSAEEAFCAFISLTATHSGSLRMAVRICPVPIAPPRSFIAAYADISMTLRVRGDISDAETSEPFPEPSNEIISSRVLSRLTPLAQSTAAATLFFPDNSPRSRCSVPMYECPNFLASASAAERAFSADGVKRSVMLYLL
ncbi:putative uncharacterized protein [Candidatus Colimorpha enterica]|uniref:Uncharacterized protein n=1 Tax=Candidatus Colimorpha enterica TaxID=3083063 RepID=R6U093_9BACT|nr:putative uncharacterized protein [Candidatus Colimorpha enterica]